MCNGNKAKYSCVRQEQCKSKSDKKSYDNVQKQRERLTSDFNWDLSVISSFLCHAITRRCRYFTVLLLKKLAIQSCQSPSEPNLLENETAYHGNAQSPLGTRTCAVLAITTPHSLDFAQFYERPLFEFIRILEQVEFVCLWWMDFFISTFELKNEMEFLSFYQEGWIDNKYFILFKRLILMFITSHFLLCTIRR